MNATFDEEMSLEIAKEVFKKTMNIMRTEAIIQANETADTGELTSKIVLNVISDYAINLESNAQHSAAREYGSSPHWAPIKPLKEWAKRKLGDENIGYAVQKKIAKEGTDAKPYMRPALDITQQIHLPMIIQETKTKYN